MRGSSERAAWAAVGVAVVGAGVGARADDLYNTLYITDQRLYDRAFGNAIGTPPSPARVLDVQHADDVVVGEATVLTRATADYFVKTTSHQLDGVWVQVFADSDGVPVDEMFAGWIATGAEVTVEDLGVLPNGPAPYDHAVRISATLPAAGEPGAIELPAGTWWVSIQPIDVRRDGNWYWILRDFGEILGASDAGRDGGAYHDGPYGGYPGAGFFPSWTSLGLTAFRAGTSAMRVEGSPFAACAADFNRDGFLDFFDYADFTACFELSDCPPGRTADFNNDGFTDFFDYGDYVAAFEAGC